MGYAWQRGLIPVGLKALERAIELNGVAVQNNLLAFALGRQAAGHPAILKKPMSEQKSDETVDDLIARGVAHLSNYQDVKWAKRFETIVKSVQRAEIDCSGEGQPLPLTSNVARSLMKLMSYKDEYEVARLYTDGSFNRQLSDQFEGDFKLEIYMAPPLLSREKNGQPPQKIALGEWILPALKLLAKGKKIRGTWFDVFGYTEERRTERRLIEQYVDRIEELLPHLCMENLPIDAQIAALPMTMRGYGHVKKANIDLALAREAELLNSFMPSLYPRPRNHPAAGQFRGISIVSHP